MGRNSRGFHRIQDSNANSTAQSGNHYQRPGQSRLPDRYANSTVLNSVPSNGEPPSYNSILEQDASRTTNSTNTHSGGGDSSANQRPSADHDSGQDLDSGASYQPPPPEYEIVTQYKGLYQVSETQPSVV